MRYLRFCSEVHHARLRGQSKGTIHDLALKRIIMHQEKDGMPITALREIKILKALDHPNIVKVLDIVVMPSTCFYWPSWSVLSCCRNPEGRWFRLHGISLYGSRPCWIARESLGQAQPVPCQVVHEAATGRFGVYARSELYQACVLKS